MVVELDTRLLSGSRLKNLDQLLQAIFMRMIPCSYLLATHAIQRKS